MSKILGQQFGVDYRVEKYGAKDAEREHTLVSLLVEDDENWIEKVTFDSYWLEDLIHVLTMARDEIRPKMNEYYILVEPWAVYVKEANFFAEQGGLTQSWGNNWQKVQAGSIEEARDLGQAEREKNARVSRLES